MYNQTDFTQEGRRTTVNSAAYLTLDRLATTIIFTSVEGVTPPRDASGQLLALVGCPVFGCNSMIGVQAKEPGSIYT